MNEEALEEKVVVEDALEEDAMNEDARPTETGDRDAVEENVVLVGRPR